MYEAQDRGGAPKCQLLSTAWHSGHEPQQLCVLALGAQRSSTSDIQLWRRMGPTMSLFGS